MTASVAQLSAVCSAKQQQRLNSQHSLLSYAGEANIAAEELTPSEALHDSPPQPAVNDAPVVHESTALPIAESADFGLEKLQQIADTIFGFIEHVLPHDVADQLRGHSLDLQVALVAVAVLLVAGTSISPS